MAESFAESFGRVWSGLDDREHFGVAEREAICRIAYVPTVWAAYRWRDIPGDVRAQLVRGGVQMMRFGAVLASVIVRAAREQ